MDRWSIFRPPTPITISIQFQDKEEGGDKLPCSRYHISSTACKSVSRTQRSMSPCTHVEEVSTSDSQPADPRQYLTQKLSSLVCSVGNALTSVRAESQQKKEKKTVAYHDSRVRRNTILYPARETSFSLYRFFSISAACHGSSLAKN